MQAFNTTLGLHINNKEQIYKMNKVLGIDPSIIGGILRKKNLLVVLIFMTAHAVRKSFLTWDCLVQLTSAESHVSSTKQRSTTSHNFQKRGFLLKDLLTNTKRRAVSQSLPVRTRSQHKLGSS